MRKLFILMLPILLVIGCSSNFSKDNHTEESDNASINNNAFDGADGNNNKSADDESQKRGRVAAETTDENEDAEKEKSDQSSDDEKEPQTNKEKYLEMLDDVEEELKPMEEKAKKGTQEEMEATEEDLYERWDVALNEVYEALERELSEKDMEVLRKEQREWIKKRDHHAKDKAQEVKGGTLYNYTLTEAKKTYTKDRCYELVKNYME
ncbi:MAG TPA: lysozyme inhibitor LprI family protein [Virgibacillus sp.]|nr:lysozyme inhibitor LprI family protein [Virgibacillus sp.]